MAVWDRGMIRVGISNLGEEMKLAITWTVAVLLTIAIFVWIQLNPTGPVIMSFTSEHGVHSGDLVVFVPILIAIFLSIPIKRRNTDG